MPLCSYWGWGFGQSRLPLLRWGSRAEAADDREDDCGVNDGCARGNDGLGVREDPPWNVASFAATGHQRSRWTPQPPHALVAPPHMYRVVGLCYYGSSPCCARLRRKPLGPDHGVCYHAVKGDWQWKRHLLLSGLRHVYARLPSATKSERERCLPQPCKQSACRQRGRGKEKESVKKKNNKKLKR